MSDMTGYYLREIMYELYQIADAVTNGKAEKARKERWEEEHKLRLTVMETMAGRYSLIEKTPG